MIGNYGVNPNPICAFLLHGAKLPSQMAYKEQSRPDPCLGIAESALFGAERFQFKKANALTFSTLFNAWLPYRSMPLIAAESERLSVECFV